MSMRDQLEERMDMKHPDSSVPNAEAVRLACCDVVAARDTIWTSFFFTWALCPDCNVWTQLFEVVDANA